MNKPEMTQQEWQEVMIFLKETYNRIVGLEVKIGNAYSPTKMPYQKILSELRQAKKRLLIAEVLSEWGERNAQRRATPL